MFDNKIVRPTSGLSIHIKIVAIESVFIRRAIWRLSLSNEKPYRRMALRSEYPVIELSRHGCEMRDEARPGYITHQLEEIWKILFPNHSLWLTPLDALSQDAAAITFTREAPTRPSTTEPITTSPSRTGTAFPI